MKNLNDRLLADRSCGQWRQGVLCVIQSLPHPDFGCVTRFAEWFCVRPSFLFSPSPLPHGKAWYSGYDNWRYQISQKRLESTSLAKTRVWAILTALPQMSRAKGDVSTWQMLLGVWVCLELTEPLWSWWTISHSNENLNSPRAKSPFMGCREKLTASGSRGRGVSNVWGKKVRAHSRVCLPLKMERLLPVHNIPWLSCAFAIHWASLR